MNTFWRPNVPQLYVDVDREKAKALGVTLDDVFDTVAATLGTYYVNDFNRYGRTWQVLMSADAAVPRASPRTSATSTCAARRATWCRSARWPTSATPSGPETLERFNNLPSVKLLRRGRAGHSSGQAIQQVEQVAKEVLPADFTLDWSGTSYQEKKASGTSVIALALAALMAFLILAAQYEKWSLPFSVLLAVPFGTFGALAAVWLRGLTNDVYFQIGLVTLVGLASKNAILIVEFASMKHQEGLSAAAAAVEAARLRFRPILMTSLAFIFGVLPLAISTGAGAGARHSVGTGVVGGMLAATFLAIFFVPLFFRLITDLRVREPRSSEEILEEAHHAREAALRAARTPLHHPVAPAGGDHA